MNGISYRVLVSTDLGGDPDDKQSLVHMLHYSDILKLEGIVSSPGPGSVNRAAKIREWVQRTDLDYLRCRGYETLMGELAVLDTVKQGATAPGRPGPGKATEGSKWIIERARAKQESTPLWVLVWGSMTDVAQALYDDPGIAGLIRLYYIGSSNTENDEASRDYVFNGMKTDWPDLWWIENGVLPKLSRDTFRGYYLGGDQSGSWGNVSFIKEVIRGRGTDHGGLFSQVLGDAFPTATWPDGVLKEGDSPSFLYLLSPVIGGVGDVNDPTKENWGGRFVCPFPERFSNYYTDLEATAEECQATINQWRVQYLADWKKRWERYDQ